MAEEIKAVPKVDVKSVEENKKIEQVRLVKVRVREDLKFKHGLNWYSLTKEGPNEVPPDVVEALARANKL